MGSLIGYIKSCSNKNLSVLSSIYQTKGFTKYAIYTAIAYQITKNPKVGLVALNTNTAAVIGFNYIRFFKPALYELYKKNVKKSCEISELTFQLGDILVHILPLCVSVYSRKYWYNKVSYRSTIAISIGSYAYQLAWAYHYAKGINVCKIYNIPDKQSNISELQWKRLWFLVFLAHNVTSVQKTVRLITKT